jgi:hypothetical protein
MSENGATERLLFPDSFHWPSAWHFDRRHGIHELHCNRAGHCLAMGAKHLSSIALLSVLVLLVQLLPQTAWASGQTFVDDFGHPSDAWRFGNEVVSKIVYGNGQKGFPLKSVDGAEATLAGTTLNPENMRTFTATLRWHFVGAGQPVLLAGWGKAQEWNTLDECQVHLSVSSAGRVTVLADKQVLGEAQLAAPVAGVYELTFRQEPQRVVVQSVEGEVAFSLPAGEEARPGYFMLRADGLGSKRGEDLLWLRRVEIESEGHRAPLTAEERNREIQHWAKQREDGNWAILEGFKAKVASETAAGHWGYKTALTVQPGLVKPGEKVEIEFHVEDSVPSPNAAHVEPDFLSVNPGAAEALKLDWQSDGHGGKTARVEVTPQRSGNWRVVWQAGTEHLSRTFAVVGPGYTVARLLITSDADMWIPNHIPGAYDLIHEYGLAVDSWSADEWTSPFSRTPEDLLTHYGVFARGRHLWGDYVMPLANLNWFIAGSPDTNLWRFDDDVQREGIQQAAQLWDTLGLGPMEILGSYTLGDNTARIARSLGVKMLDSLCQWQNWRDGGSDNNWLINHVGVPALPYYVADDDFRKIAPGRSIVAFTQNTNSNVRLYDIMTSEGEPQTNFRREHAEAMGESSNIDRFETVVDLWLAEALHQPEPLFLSVGLENFVDSPDWNEANKLSVRYLREQARSQKLVFASAADIAGYFQRHYAVQPENWIMWPDTYAGQAGAYKPRQLPDRIEVSNAKFHTVHEDGSAMPRFFWDYTQPWSEPVWDDQSAIRQKYGLVNPDLLTADNSVPRMVNLDGIRARVEQHSHDSEVNVTVTVDALRAIATLPVAVWRVPLSPDGLTATVASRNARYLTVVDGSTGNTHGLLVCSNVPKGRSLWVVHLKGQPRQPINPQVKIGAHVRGRMFLREGVPHTYLWLAEALTPSGMLKIRIPEGRVATVHYNDGKTEQGSGGELSVLLDRDWRRQSPLVTGLSAEEIMRGASFKALDSSISRGK